MKARLLKHEGQRILVVDERPNNVQPYFYENWTKYRIIAKGSQIALKLSGNARVPMTDEELDKITECEVAMDRHWDDGEEFEVLYVNNKVTIHGTEERRVLSRGTKKRSRKTTK